MRIFGTADRAESMERLAHGLIASIAVIAAGLWAIAIAILIRRGS